MTDQPQQNGAEQHEQGEMRIDPQRAAQLAENLAHVQQRIQSASNGRKVYPTTSPSPTPHLLSHLLTMLPDRSA